MSAAQNALEDRLRTLPNSDQRSLAERYGNDSVKRKNRMAVVAGNIVGTLFSMVRLHVNLKSGGG